MWDPSKYLFIDRQLATLRSSRNFSISLLCSIMMTLFLFTKEASYLVFNNFLCSLFICVAQVILIDWRRIPLTYSTQVTSGEAWSARFHVTPSPDPWQLCLASVIITGQLPVFISDDAIARSKYPTFMSMLLLEPRHKFKKSLHSLPPHIMALVLYMRKPRKPLCWSGNMYFNRHGKNVLDENPLRFKNTKNKCPYFECWYSVTIMLTVHVEGRSSLFLDVIFAS